MKKIILNVCLLFATFQLATAQKISTFFLELGPTLSTFQDQKFSDVQLSGVGGSLHLGGHTESSTGAFGYGLKLRVGQELASTYEVGSVIAVHPTFYVQYARRINEKLSLGVHWDIFEVYFRNIKGLMNNGNYALASSDLLLKGQFDWNKWRAGLDVGILSYNRESIGFGFSASQNALEEGRFDYQNEALNNPLGLEFFELKSLNHYLKLRSNIQYQLSNRFGLGYEWELRRITNVENYPATLGVHRLTLRWNIRYKIRNQDRR